MLHARKTRFSFQVLIRLQPGWNLSACGMPMSIRSFVTPAGQQRHHGCVSIRTAKGFHRLLALPDSQSPEGKTCINQQSSTDESWRPHHLTLSQEVSPEK